ncbi:MAG: hypothetical protein DHS20C20_17230 [Ardenticatenaceae bacterium]|nr:MAG: hypothetical protein DHS20C20_17230 [Ardenticatenaceae bacterium]
MAEINPRSWPKFSQEWLEAHQLDGDLVLVIEGDNTKKAGDTTRVDIVDLT